MILHHAILIKQILIRSYSNIKVIHPMIFFLILSCLLEKKPQHSHSQPPLLMYIMFILHLAYPYKLSILSFINKNKDYSSIRKCE